LKNKKEKNLEIKDILHKSTSKRSNARWCQRKRCHHFTLYV